MILVEDLGTCAPANRHFVNAADRFEVFVDKVPHDVKVLVNMGLSDHRASHETVVVSLLGGTIIFHLTELNGVDISLSAYLINTQEA